MFARIWNHQNAHSLYVSAAGVLFAATLAFDQILGAAGISPNMHWVLLIVSILIAPTALWLGKGLPVTFGLIGVALFTVATITFVSTLGNVQSAVSSAQELPIIALYLGWFVPRPYGRIIMLIFTVLLIGVMASNPLFHPTGVLGVPMALQVIVIGLLCFEVGTFLWRRTELQIENDTLTGVLSRQAFRSRLQRTLARARPRSGEHALLGTLVLIDFDDFKSINDRLGHAYGDAALVGTVAGLRVGLRRSDAVGRVGGDEFAIWFEQLGHETSAEIMRRLRGGSAHPWSWGGTELQRTDTLDAAFARADTELLRAKRARL